MTAEPTPLTRVRDHSHDPAVTPPASVEEMVGIFGPDWTGGLSSEEFVRRQRDDRWTPPRHHCPSGICADMAAAANLDEQAADHRSFEAWARTVKGEIRRAKAVRGKRVRMLRRALTGAQP